MNVPCDVIFVCTDNEQIIAEIDNEQSQFEFVYNEKAKRNATSAEFVWFLDQMKENDLWNIIIDIEMMRMSEYLIGSATSNVYRLAMELHFVEHWAENQNKAQYEQTI